MPFADCSRDQDGASHPAILIYLHFLYTCISHILAILIYLQFSYTCNSYILAILIYNYNKVPLTFGILLLCLRNFCFKRKFRKKAVFLLFFPWISLCPGHLGTGNRLPAFVPHMSKRYMENKYLKIHCCA